MKDDYRYSIEGKRRFENPELYKKFLEFQKEMKEYKVAIHNPFANECTMDFCCCEGDGDYLHYFPSERVIIKQALEELYQEIKHGDEEHQDWLKNKMNEFLRSNY
jgi:hypothetical protein